MGMISGNAPPSGFGSMASPQIARAAEQAKSNLSAKGGQPPSPQQLGQALQQQAMQTNANPLVNQMPTPQPQQQAIPQTASRMGKGGQPLTPEMAQEGMANIVRSRAMRNRGQY